MQGNGLGRSILIKCALLTAALMAILLLLIFWRLQQRLDQNILKIFTAQYMIVRDETGRCNFGMRNGLHSGIGGAMIYTKDELGLNGENCEEKYHIRFEISDVTNGRMEEILPALVIAVKPGYEPITRIPQPDAPAGGKAVEPPSPFQELKGQRVILKFAGRYLSLPQRFYDEIEVAMEELREANEKNRD